MRLCAKFQVQEGTRFRDINEKSSVVMGHFAGKIKATYCASRGFGRLKKSPKTLLVTDVLT